MILVADASSVLASILPDERAGRDVLELLRTSTAIAPMIWPLEIANALLVATWRRRITIEEAEILMETLAEIEIELVPTSLSEITREVFPIASKHTLTIYDAQYVHLARSRSASLLTLDKKLRAAAGKESVVLA